MPWERQPGEGIASWQGFTTYRNMGLARSSAKAAKKASKQPSNYRVLCTENDWVARAAAWDAEVDRHHRKVLLSEQRKMFAAHLKLSRKILKKVTPFFDQIKFFEPADVARFMTLAVKLQQTTLGLRTEPAEPEADKPLKSPMQAYFDSLPDSRIREIVSQALNKLPFEGKPNGEATAVPGQ